MSKDKTMTEEMDVDMYLLDEKVIETVDESSFLRKMDARLMFLFSLGYFVSYLDRAAISNAKIAGMMEDLNLTDAQFSTISSILYATYITTQIPGVMLMRKFKANWYLATMITGFSMITIFTIFVQNFVGMIVVRLLLGFFEGSFFSCMAVYTTNCYEPHELGKRFGYLFVSSSISSAFGGLIGTGITKIDSGPLEKWRYLFLIEGLLSFIVALLFLFLLPANYKSLFKTEEELKIYEIREERRRLFMGQEKFQLKHAMRTFKSLKTYTSIIIQFCQDICLYGFSTFLPSILKLGLGFDSLQAQYLTIPVYLFAGALFLATAILSDRLRLRGPLMAFMNIFTITGYIILLAVNNDGVKYFACYLICFSLYTNVGLNESWITSNTAPRDKRATSLAANQAFGNVAGIVSPQVYRGAPYTLGHWFTMGCLIFGTLTIMLQSYLYYKTNKERQLILDSAGSEFEEMEKGDKSVKFKFIL